MKLLKKIDPLQAALSACLVLYIMTLEPWNGMDPSLPASEKTGIYGLFALFFIAFVISWKRQYLAGLLLLAWYLGIWILAGIFEDDAGISGIVAGLAVMVLGVFYIIQGKRKPGARPDERTEWKAALTLFTGAVSLLYLLTVIHNLFMGGGSYLHTGGVFYLVALLLLYGAAAAFSRKHESMAGILFMAWSAGVFVLGIVFRELEFERTVGLSVFFLGFLLIFFDRVIKKRNPIINPGPDQ